MSLESTYDSLHSARLRLERMCTMLEIELQRCKERQAEIEMMRRLNNNSLIVNPKIELDSTIPVRKITGYNA